MEHHLKVTQRGALSTANAVITHGYRTCPSQKKLESASSFLSACSSQGQDCQLIDFLKAWSGQGHLTFTGQEKQ